MGNRDKIDDMPRFSFKHLLTLLALIAVITAGIWLGRFVADDATAQVFVRDLGFLGIFLVAFGSGFNLVVPIPAAAFVPSFTAAGYGFWTVIGVMTFGLTAADLIAFYIGRAGRSIKEKPSTGWIARIEKYQETHPQSRALILFLYASFFPLPNEVLLLPLGYLKARPRDIILPILFGNFIFNALASSGVLAIGSLL